MRIAGTKSKLVGWLALGAIVAAQSLACGAAAPAPNAPAAAKPEGPGEPEPKPAAGAAARPVMQKPEWIPIEAREMLAARMRRHGEEMMFLVVSVVILSYDSAENLALEIASEPKIGRPAPGEKGTISALLPPRFFDYQDELRDRADQVADAAHEKDPSRLVRAYGQLSETCVACHVAYMEAEPPREGLDE